jgi:replicative DNA helicase
VEERLSSDTMDIERAVLGAILVEGRAALDQVDLSPAHFSAERQVIFAAILEVASKGLNPDAMAVVQVLRDAGKLDAAGGAAEVDRLADELPDVANIRWYAGKLKRAALERDLRAKVAGLTDQATPRQVAELARAAEALKAWDEGGSDDDPNRGTVTAFLAEWDTRKTTKPHPLIGDLSIADGELMVLVGPQKLGKSAFACQCADEVARSGRPVLYFTFDMPSFEVLARVITPHVSPGVFYSDIVRRGLNQKQQEAFRRAAEEYPGAKYLRVLQPDPARTEEGGSVWMRRVVEAEADRRGVAPFVVVDYLQRMREPAQKERRLEVGTAAYNLRAMVDALELPLLAIASIARDNYPTAGGKRNDGWFGPAEDIAKESGEIEYGATSLYALWPSEMHYDKYIKEHAKCPPDHPAVLELYRLLHRHGGASPKQELVYLSGIGRFEPKKKKAGQQ